MLAETRAREGPACCELMPSEIGGGGGGEPALEIPDVARVTATTPTMHAHLLVIGAAPPARRRNARSCRLAASRMSRARSARPRDQAVDHFDRSAAHAGDQRLQRLLAHRRDQASKRRRADGLTTSARERLVTFELPPRSAAT